MDLDYFDNVVVSSLEKRGWFEMANEPLANAYYEKLKIKFPNLIMIKEGIRQHFVLTEERLKQLRQSLENKEKRLEEELSGTRLAIIQIDCLPK